MCIRGAQCASTKQLLCVTSSMSPKSLRRRLGELHKDLCLRRGRLAPDRSAEQAGSYWKRQLAAESGFGRAMRPDRRFRERSSSRTRAPKEASKRVFIKNPLALPQDRGGVRVEKASFQIKRNRIGNFERNKKERQNKNKIIFYFQIRFIV